MIIGFSKARSPFAIGSKIIAAAEKSDFSHVFMRCPDTDTKLDMVYQASHGYVNTMTYSRFTTQNVVVKEYTLPTTPEQHTEMLTFMKSNLGVPYSRLQIVIIAVKKLLHIKLDIHNGTSAEICSEFGARVAKIDGITTPSDLDYETPSDLDHLLHNNNIPCTKD